MPKKKVELREKVTPGGEVEKVIHILNDMEEPVHTMRKKDLDNVQGQSTGSTGWSNLDHEWLNRKFSILKTYFYNFFEKDIEGQDIKTYKTFVVPFNNTNVNLSMCNDSVRPNK